MPGYRRFIAYVYEYPQGKKGNGKGFIKVEARDGICRMQYKLSGIYGSNTAPAKIYGYVRRNQSCMGVLLGKCDLAGDAVQFECEMPENNMGDSSYTLEDLCGLILLSDSGVMYGSGWDDKPIDLGEILLPEGNAFYKENRDEFMRAAEREEEPAVECTFPEALNQELSRREREREREAENTVMPERPMNPTRPGQEMPESPMPPTRPGEEMPERPMPPTRPGEEMPERPMNPVRPGQGMPERPMNPVRPGQGMSEGAHCPGSDFRQEGAVSGRGMEQFGETVDMREESVEEGNSSDKIIPIETAGQAASRRDAFMPFSDNAFSHCKKITPEDFRILSKGDRGLMYNHFLRHGYSQYGHLLLGRREEDNRYILGIPGVYDGQEAVMANMFGFPYFKETGENQNRNQRSGYWYRFIEEPDCD